MAVKMFTDFRQTCHFTQGSLHDILHGSNIYPVLQEKYCSYFDYGLDAT